MGGNLNKDILGKCGKCGGLVSVDRMTMSVNRPIPRCEGCGATPDLTAGLPTMKMN